MAEELNLTLADTPLTPESAAGLNLSTLHVMIQGSEGALEAPTDYVAVFDATDRATPRALRLDLGSLRARFRGTVDPGEFVKDPPAAYDPLFMFIERHLANFCSAQGKPVRDEEFEKLFGEMRRRPDGRYTSALYVHLRAVLALLLTVRPTSEAEYNAVMSRLTRSARTFRTSVTSTNYYDNVLVGLLGG